MNKGLCSFRKITLNEIGLSFFGRNKNEVLFTDKVTKGENVYKAT